MSEHTECHATGSYQPAYTQATTGAGSDDAIQPREHMAQTQPHFECFVQAVLDIAALRRQGRNAHPITEACREASERAYWLCTPDERRLGDSLCIAIDDATSMGGETAR